MILPHNTIVVVADGENFKLFRNKGTEPHIKLVALPSPKLVPVNKGSGMYHTSTLANPDEKRREEDKFAAAAAEYINSNVLDGEFASLYVIADPRTLGEMRRHYHSAVIPLVVGEMAKDLTHHTTEELEYALLNT